APLVSPVCQFRANCCSSRGTPSDQDLDHKISSLARALQHGLQWSVHSPHAIADEVTSEALLRLRRLRSSSRALSLASWPAHPRAQQASPGGEAGGKPATPHAPPVSPAHSDDALPPGPVCGSP